MKNEKETKDNDSSETEEPIISRFADSSTFQPRVVIKGAGKNPLDTTGKP